MRAEPAAGKRPGETGGEQVPLDARGGRVRDEASHAEQEPDDEVRARRAAQVEPHGAQERRHAQRPEDDADRAADRTDHEPEPAAGPRRRCSRGRGSTGRSARSIPLHTSTAAITAVERGLRDVVGDSAPSDRSEHRRRRHPGDDVPVDAALARVPEPAGAAAAAEIAMFVPAAASGLPDASDDQRQPQRPEHEPERRAPT